MSKEVANETQTSSRVAITLVGSEGQADRSDQQDKERWKERG